MKIYHITYEPTYKSVDIHFWTKCNLNCRSCYTNYEKLDFGLLDDPIATIATKSREKAPDSFLSLEGVIKILKDIDIEHAIFMGTEPVLDPELPLLAEKMHRISNCYIAVLTNGVRRSNLEHIDEVILSLKAFSDDLHRDYTGRSNKGILNNLRFIYASGKKLQVETVFIPDYIDAGEIESIAQFVAGIDTAIPLRIDAYFPVGDRPWRAAAAGEVEAAAELARKHLSNVSCLTLDMKRIGDKSVRLF